MTIRVMAQKSLDVSAESHRFAIQALFAPAGPLDARSGVLPKGGTTPPADLVAVSALVAKVTPFQAFIDGTSNTMQAGYVFTSDLDTNLTFAVGNGVNPRIDLVVARIRDHPYDASGVQTGVLEIVQGTAAGSPVAPAVPASSLALWQVLVPANASGGNPIVFASARTDRRTYTGARGEAILIASSTERAAIASPYAGMSIYRTDTKTVEVYDGTGWVAQGVAIVASIAARNALASPTAGMAVYRTDTKWVERYDGTAWRVEGAAPVANFAALATQITNPFDGQLAVTLNDNRTYQYDTAAATWFTAEPRPVFAEKTAIESVANSAVLQNDDQLFVDLVAGHKYKVECALYVANPVGTGDIQTNWSTTGTIVATGPRRTAAGATLTTTDPLNTAMIFAATGFGTQAYGVGAGGSLIMETFIVTVTVSGRLQLQWAQNVANASATNVYEGSYLIATPLT